MNYSLQIYGFYDSLRTVIPQNTQIMAFSGDCCLSINTMDEERTSAWCIPWWRNEWRFPQTTWLWKIHSENGSNSRRITGPFEVSGDKFGCQIITWYEAQQEGYVSTNLRQIAVIDAISERHSDVMIQHGSYLNTMAAIFSWLMITDGNSIPYAKERILSEGYWIWRHHYRGPWSSWLKVFDDYRTGFSDQDRPARSVERWTSHILFPITTDEYPNVIQHEICPGGTHVHRNSDSNRIACDRIRWTLNGSV